MLCVPSTARRAIDSFQHGTVLFMPFHYSRQAFSTFTASASSSSSSTATLTTKAVAATTTTTTAPKQELSDPPLYDYHYNIQHLNVWTYYLLVVLSFTGLSTVLRQTRVFIAREEEEQELDVNQPLAALTQLPHQQQALVVDPCVLQYIQQRHGNLPLFLVRRFEYYFPLASISVVMFHIHSGASQSNNNGDSNIQNNSNNTLHLVEVYRIQNPILRALLGASLDVSHWIVITLSSLGGCKEQSMKQRKSE
jgi:hypothetical protein